MSIFMAILKNKLFYIVLAITFIVNSAMDINATCNKDLLDAYYQSSTADENLHRHKSKRDSVVDYSKLLIGKPYKYAGKGPEGFDCSGFTSYVFRHFNVTLPVSSALQAKYGEMRLIEDVRKGDLLMFRDFSKKSKDVGHVAIVVSADNGKVSFIHSSTSRGVVIDSLDHPYYNEHYMGARDVLEDGN